MYQLARDSAHLAATARARGAGEDISWFSTRVAKGVHLRRGATFLASEGVAPLCFYEKAPCLSCGARQARGVAPFVWVAQGFGQAAEKVYCSGIYTGVAVLPFVGFACAN